MNAAELRYRVTQYLNGLSQPAAVERADLVPPVPGQPLATEVTVLGVYTSQSLEASPKRRFRITFEEID